MNYYARLYLDDYNPENIKIHISVLEVYEIAMQEKARVLCDVNITDNTLCKYVKQPYTIINNTEPIIILNKKHGENTFTRLSHLLNAEGYSLERIEQISLAIHNITNNATIKSNQNCLGEWITF
jgi:hypothetical protein